MVRSLADYLENSARRYPDRVAVVDGTGATLTYAELNGLADRVAATLIDHGVVPGDRVGVVTPKRVRTVASLFGIMKARAAYVPVDYTAPATRNATILSDCQVKGVILHHLADGIAGTWPSGTAPDVVIAIGDREHTSTIGGAPLVAWSDVERATPRDTSRDRSIDDLAYILYTSGSTGIPKGVMLTHRNATSFVDWCSSVFEPTPEDRFGSHAPFHFDLSVLDIYVSLKHGAGLYLVDENVGESPKALADFISAHRLSIWYSTPSILTLLAQFGDLASRDFSALRTMLFAGEVFPIKHLRHLTRLWPGRAYYNLYGPTETNVCTYFKIPEHIPDDRNDPYPIGHLCAHCDGLLLDQDGVEVPRGEEGLLYIAGPSVFPGYWNRPVENAACFLERHGRRWYNTGDVVREDERDGYIYLGRRDRMVKRHGYRIELGEIERALYQHESIAEAAVVSVSDTAGVKIIAYLSARGPERPTVIDMKAYCARSLPAYMSPDVFRFVDAAAPYVDEQGGLPEPAAGIRRSLRGEGPCPRVPGARRSQRSR
jgi:amino acid adenylation domain-containing protein